MPESNGQYETVIGSDASFKGELKFEKSVRVLGRIEGQISTKGDLYIAEGGRLKADVSAGNVQIEGRVEGNLAATGKVLLKSSAQLEGDLRAARLEVAEGAVFVGNCTVGPQNNGQPAATTGSAKTSSKSAEPAAKTKSGNGQTAVGSRTRDVKEVALARDPRLGLERSRWARCSERDPTALSPRRRR